MFGPFNLFSVSGKASRKRILGFLDSIIFCVHDSNGHVARCEKTTDVLTESSPAGAPEIQKDEVSPVAPSFFELPANPTLEFPAS